MNNSSLAFCLSPEAAKFVLFQRTEYLFFRRNVTVQKFVHMLPRRLSYALESLFSNFDAVVSLEARVARKKIGELFALEMEKEYKEMQAFLPEKAKAILDIGCGIGGINVFLRRHYETQNSSFYLLDKTEMPKRVYYGHREKASFYNSLSDAKGFLRENGVPEEQIFTQEATDDNRIEFTGPFDLVVSLISWGFHYPVAVYLDQVYAKLAPGGVLVMDVRKAHGGIEEVQKKFGAVAIIHDASKHVRLVARKPSV